MDYFKPLSGVTPLFDSLNTKSDMDSRQDSDPDLDDGPDVEDEEAEHSEKVDYDNMSLKALRAELKKRGARVAGRKGDLLNRLQDLCGIQRQEPPVASPDIQLPGWPSSSVFRSVGPQHQLQVPPITCAHIQAYVQQGQGNSTVVGPDRGPLKKGKKLSESNLQALSFVVHGSDNMCFVSGCVQAQMKKKVVYVVRLIVRSNGEISHSTCDCPSGIGPRSTCKHVCAAAFALADIKAGNKVVIQQSCTDTLQAFHRPVKAHIGSPVKAANLFKNNGESDDDDDDDPRPKKFRNRASYSTDVQNATVAFSFYSGMDVAFRYSFGQADLQTASIDHDYLRKPMTQV